MLKPLLPLLALTLSLAAHAQSFYPERLVDPTAVYVDAPTTDHDATASLQQAIDKVADTTHQGIVFLQSGRYRITHTLYVWPGVRVIGYGATRPVLTLPANTPGYANAPAYMVVFTGGRTGERRRGGLQPTRPITPMPFAGSVPPQTGVVDANPGTFYSAMSNVDFEIGDGNPGAVGIRFHVAQHCFLTHMDFHIGSGMAALQDIGNEAEDLHFFGGQFGIVTGRPSPGWQFTLLDSTFEGQRTAAIKEHEAGLALIHDTFRNVPAAIDIEAHHIEELWLENSRFENISGPAITISEETSRLTEINLRNVVCHGVPAFAKLRESGKTFPEKGAAKGDTYRIASFTQGLTFDGAQNKSGVITSHVELAAITANESDTKSAIPALPAQTGWANAHDLGVKGDGTTDDTAALQQAVNTHRILYLPSGRYKLTDTLRLRPDSVLIGLHPSTTQLDLPDNTPSFTGAGEPKALLLAPAGGATIVTGIGLWTGGSNNLATAAMWSSGKDSLMDDVRFLGGHGTNNPDGSRMDPYNSTHSGDPNPLYKWDAQYPSLWVTNGGGGIFADIWTPDTFAQAGLYVSNTATEGHVYELSSEHHVRNEIVLRGVSNWELVALQTEEERGEGGRCLPLSIQDSLNITVAEMHAYRVVSSNTPFEETIRVNHSDNIAFRNLHIYSDSKAVFDGSVRDLDTGNPETGTLSHELELASLTLLPKRSAPMTSKACHPSRSGGSASCPERDDTPGKSTTQPKRLVTGFFNAASLTAAPDGTLYFVDGMKQNIYSFSPASNKLSVVSDRPIDPANLLFDNAGNLLIVSYTGKGSVYATHPNEAGVTMHLLQPQPATTPIPPNATPVLPIDHWRFDNERRSDIGSIPKPWRYVSPDGSVMLPAGDDFVEGQLYYGTKMADVLRAFALRRASVGSTFYVSDEGQERTYAGTVQPDGSLKDVRIFADRGGESTITGPDGRIYIAAGAVYIYSREGKQLGTIETPERPTALLFGGPNNRTLYILTRTSLYSTNPSQAH